MAEAIATTIPGADVVAAGVSWRSRTCPVTGLRVHRAAEQLIKVNAVCAVLAFLVGVTAAILIGTHVLPPGRRRIRNAAGTSGRERRCRDGRERSGTISTGDGRIDVDPWFRLESPRSDRHCLRFLEAQLRGDEER